jgi:hypothetical protein
MGVSIKEMAAQGIMFFCSFKLEERVPSTSEEIGLRRDRSGIQGEIFHHEVHEDDFGRQPPADYRKIFRAHSRNAFLR